jgi:hypothetical protein
MKVGYNQAPFWTYYSWDNFSRIKPIAWVLREAAKGEAEGPASDESERLLAGSEREGGAVERNAAPTRLLKRLGPADLIFYGVGSTVGAGIYSLIGPGLKEAGSVLCVATKPVVACTYGDTHKRAAHEYVVCIFNDSDHVCAEAGVIKPYCRSHKRIFYTCPPSLVVLPR